MSHQRERVVEISRRRPKQRAQDVEALLVRHEEAMVRLAYVLTRDQDIAEDLAQEAFVRAFARLQHLRSADSLAGYLRTTIVNLARDRWRRQAVERSFLANHARAEPMTVDSHLEDQDEMWMALMNLPHRQRVAIVLRYYEDLSEREAADVMQCTVGALKSLVSRGMTMLRQEMEVEREG